MSQTYQVAVLVGSLRKKSFNRMLAKSIAQMAQPALSLSIVEIGDMPFYNEELEEDVPAAWRRVREAIGAADAVLFVSPEYNRSIPAVLKNAVDVLSRPYGKGALGGKPAAVVTSSPGALGGFGANHHLRQSIVGLGMKVMGVPETYVGGIGTAFDAQGNLINPSTREFLEKFTVAFQDWIALTAAR
jgi:chromate reductase